MELNRIRKELILLQRKPGEPLPVIRTVTGPFELADPESFADAELIFAYFKEAGDDFCRFLISRRKYSSKTVFLFGIAYECFDGKMIRDYYRLGKEEYALLTNRKDSYYKKGLRELLNCIVRRVYGTSNVDSLSYG